MPKPSFEDVKNFGRTGQAGTNGHHSRNGSTGDFDDPDVFYEAIIERLSDVEPEPLSWLWPGRILANKITLIGGDPAVGKGFVTMDIAARATMGKPWPDQLGIVRDPVNVLWMTTEDAGGDTLRPRIEAAGGDAKRFFTWKGIKKIKLEHRTDADEGESAARRETQLSIHLQRDAEVLEKLIRQYEAKVLVVDPITGYLPGTDIFRDNEIRAVLGPLATVASDHGVAILPVMHLNKTQGGQALKRFIGSVAFGAQARMAYLVAPDPEDPEKRLFLQVKNNVTKKADGLRFQVVDYLMRWRSDLEIDTAKVEWLVDEPVFMDADDIVGDDSGKLSDAIDFLTDYLSDGAHTFEDIERECAKRTIAIKTLRRAKTRLHIDPEKAQGQPHGSWWWALPSRKAGPIA